MLLTPMMLMNLKSRVSKLEKKATMMAKGRGRLVSSRFCKGASFDELMQMIEESLLPKSVPVLETIVKQIKDYQQRPPRKLPNGEMSQRIHGFMDWLRGLQAGSSFLPEKLPPDLLLAWRNGYVNHPAGVTPIPVRRCEDCLLVLPNCSPDGFGPCIHPCPVCGSENISHKKLSGPPCDPMHIYTPLPTPMRPDRKHMEL
jgi:hypothetical protein